MQSLVVSLEQRSYPIAIGIPEPQELAEAIQRLRPKPSQVVVVYDERVHAIAEPMVNGLRISNNRVHMLSVPSGEGSKSARELERLWAQLLACNADRKSILVAVGGGVIGDLAGFAAATWNRGIRFVQVPTTLLAMVDSSVGGKTGINLPEAKNVVGAFWQPSLVWSDLTALASLPEREFCSGIAEVVKYGVILDEVFFSFLETHAKAILDRDPDSLATIIGRSCELKAEVVAADERETTGLRAILNYGHTFGHAIESLTEYGVLLHGEAISIGMSMAGSLALALGRWTEDAVRRQTDLLLRFRLPTRFGERKKSPLQVDDLLVAMMHDKKNDYGRLNLILPDRIGHVETVNDAPRQLIEQAIRNHL